MADKTPVRVVFNSSNVATGMAEFQSGETVPVANGGTGLSSIGSAGQVLRTNAAGNALEFATLEDLADIISVGSTLTAPSNADFNITTAGTGNIVLNDLSISDNTLSTNRSNDDLNINASGTGTVVLENLKIGTSGSTVTTILDEDNMSSNSATSLATQQSIKAYVDSEVGSVSTTAISQLNSNVTVADAGSGTITVTVDGSTIGDFTASGLQLGGSGARVTTVLDEDGFGTNSDTALATQQSIKAYVDSQLTAQDLDFATDDSTALNIDLDSETLQVSGGANITTSGSNNTITIALDTTLTGLSSVTSTALVTNNISSSDSTAVRIDDALNVDGALDVGAGFTISNGQSITSILDEDAMGSNSANALATQQSIKAYVDTQDANIASDTLTFTNKTFDVEGTGNSISNIDVADFKASAIVLESEGIGSNDNDTTLPTSAAVKDYVDTQITAEDLDITADDSTAISIDLDSEVLHFAGGNGISTSVSENTVTTAIDTGTVVTLTDSQTLTNKVLTNPTINAFSGTGNGSITGTLSIDNTTTSDSLLITSTEDSNSAGPVITLKRNSGSPADADYLGRVNFKGENDADQAVTYARISGKILDASDGSEDGAIEFNTIKAGSSTISARLASDELKLLNGTTLDVDGAGTFAGSVTATSIVTNDIVSNGSNAELTIASSGTGDTIVDSGGDIILDADNADVILKDGGTEFGRLSRVSSDLVVKSATNNKDIVFKGVDDSSTITALTLDMSEAGAATFNDIVVLGTNKELRFVDTNESIKSDGSKLIVKSGGTTFNLPTADGSAGQALVTDGAGTLSFDTVATTISDDTLATVRNNKSLSTAARTIDSINATFIDSAFYFVVHNDLVNEVISAEMLSITNNDSASFLGSRRGIESAGGSNIPTLTTDVTNGQFRLRATGTSADCKASFYKVAVSSTTTDATRGNTVTTSNTDVDSASESIDTFAHATFRGAKYFISVDNDSKTEMDVVEALVVHNGSNAFITSYGHTRSGSNALITLTAAISGDNVVVSAAGLEPNLNLTIHKILLKDNMTAQSNANQKAFAAVTTSSTATAIDLMDLDEANGAVYFIVGANSTENAFSIQEVYTAATPGVPAVANGPFVSTKSTTQLEFTAAFDTASENSLELFASSTSGGSTTVSGYRISALAG